MGNGQSKSEEDFAGKSMDYLEVIENPHFGVIKVYEGLKKNYMQIRFTRSFQQQKIWIQKLKRIKNKNSSHLLLPLDYSNSTEGLKRIVGSDFILIDYDSYPYLLSGEIRQRKQKGKDFQQTQLWLLLYFLVQAHQEMQKLDLECYGSIQPKHIFLSKQGHLKIATSLSWPDTRLETYRFTDSKFSYFAPQVLSCLEDLFSKGKTQNSDSFSIGLTILSAINLENYEYLYSSCSFGKAAFDQKEFITILNTFMQNSIYSQIFRATICSLLDLTPERRLSEGQTKNWLEKYRVKILQKEHFEITDPPNQVLRQIKLIQSLVQYSRVH